MYKFEVKVHIKGNNYYEKNRNTIQLLTKNISAISIAIGISWVGHTREINYIVRLAHIRAQYRSLTHRLPRKFVPTMVLDICGHDL